MTESTAGGDLPDIQIRMQQQAAGEFQPLAGQIFGKTAVHVPGEKLGDVVAAHPQMTTDICTGNHFPQMTFQIVKRLFQHPVRRIAGLFAGSLQRESNEAPDRVQNVAGGFLVAVIDDRGKRVQKLFK